MDIFLDDPFEKSVMLLIKTLIHFFEHHQIMSSGQKSLTHLPVQVSWF